MRKPDLDYRIYWWMVAPSVTKIVMYINEFFLKRILSSALYLSAL